MSLYVQVFGRRRHQALSALGRPASEKRQGTKSRSAGQRLGGERYGDFRLAAHWLEARHPGDAARMPGARWWRERGRRVRDGVEAHHKRPGAWIAVNRGGRDRRGRGANATKREGGVRRKSGS